METVKLRHLIKDNETTPKDILKNNNAAFRGGLFLNPSGEITIMGNVNGYASVLRTQAQQALSEHNSIHILYGFFWNIIIPARAYLIISMPISEQEENLGAIAMLYPLNQVYRQMDKSFQIIFPCLLVNMLILLTIALFRFRRFLLLPLTKLIRLTDTYHEEGTAPFTALVQNNELGQLSSSLQKMLYSIENDRKKLRQTVASLESANQELLATRTEMIRTEKLASVGMLAAGLAHEIGNPLGVVQGYISLLGQDNITVQEQADFTNRAEKEIQRISRLLRQLLDFSRINSNRCLEPVSIHTILRNLLEMINTCQPVVDEINNLMDLTAEHDIVRGDADQLQQVFFNCLLNATDALIAVTGAQIIKIKTIIINGQDNDKKDTKNARKEKRKIRVTITDSGEGIEPEHISKIFDPFFTTKEPGKGTGLGLSVAFSIIEQHGGTMEVESRAGQGTTIIIDLPLSQISNDNGSRTES